MPSGTIIHSSSKATEGVTRNQPGLDKRRLPVTSAVSGWGLAVVVFMSAHLVSSAARRNWRAAGQTCYCLG